MSHPLLVKDLHAVRINLIDPLSVLPNACGFLPSAMLLSNSLRILSASLAKLTTMCILQKKFVIFLISSLDGGVKFSQLMMAVSKRSDLNFWRARLKVGFTDPWLDIVCLRDAIKLAIFSSWQPCMAGYHGRCSLPLDVTEGSNWPATNFLHMSLSFATLFRSLIFSLYSNISETKGIVW